MALTRDSNETIRKRIEIDPGFTQALLTEAFGLMLGGMEQYCPRLRRVLTLSWK